MTDLPGFPARDYWTVVKIEEPKFSGYYVKIIREKRGWSQAELARISGVSKVTISRVENSRVKPRITTISRLARGLGVDIEGLLSSQTVYQR